MSKRPLINDTKHALADRGDDLYQTPPEAVRALMRAERLSLRIWEPCCGPGAIVRVLRQAGHHVIATDLVDYGCEDSQSRIDFLMERAAPPGVEAIVTNFPYKLAAEMIRHGLTLVPRMYLLLRFAFMESERRADILESGQLRRVFVFTNKLPMLHRAGWSGPRMTTSPTVYAWFCWDRSYRGPIITKRITWKPEQICAGCGERFDPSRAHAVTCSPRCRQRLHRSRKPSHFAARRRASVTRERVL
jgi:hypothetical protein